MHPITFHLLPNAHLDPVWLWDWREGLNEGLINCRTVLDLMDEFPDLTFIRGEAAISSHIEQNDPETVARIRQRVAEGRGDVVSGTWIQPGHQSHRHRNFQPSFSVRQGLFRSAFRTCPRSCLGRRFVRTRRQSARPPDGRWHDRVRLQPTGHPALSRPGVLVGRRGRWPCAGVPHQCRLTA